MVQVQVRVPEKTVYQLDKWINRGEFKSRSEAIKTILALYEERRKTREFYEMLVKRSKEAKDKPEILIPLEDISNEI